MTTFIQSISNVGGVATVSPLHALRDVSQSGLVATPPAVTPSSITSLGPASASAPLTYDAISLLQSFSPTFSVSGLTPAQQKQLALALGLNVNASSTDLTNAINALLTPTNPADALLNIFVGGAAAETNPAIPNPLNAQAITGNPLAVSANPTAVVPSAATIITTPVATALTANATPIAFNNPDSVLQTLLSDAASHALITATQTASIYAAPGTVYQLSSGVDHTRQANLKGKVANIRDTLNPVARVAAVRGKLEQKT